MTWTSKKQKVIVLSSAEAEFRGISKGVRELLWLKSLIIEIDYTPSDEISLYCDNRAAIQIAQNSVQHDQTKHMEIDRHFSKKNLKLR